MGPKPIGVRQITGVWSFLASVSDDFLLLDLIISNSLVSEFSRWSVCYTYLVLLLKSVRVDRSKWRKRMHRGALLPPRV